MYPGVRATKKYSHSPKFQDWRLTIRFSDVIPKSLVGRWVASLKRYNRHFLQPQLTGWKQIYLHNYSLNCNKLSFTQFLLRVIYQVLLKHCYLLRLFDLLFLQFYVNETGRNLYQHTYSILW